MIMLVPALCVINLTDESHSLWNEGARILRRGWLR